MLDLNEKLMQAKGAIIDFKIWRRNRLSQKINRMEDKLDKKNENIDKCIGNWLDGWSDVLDKEGYEMADGSRIDFKKAVLERD